MKSPPMGLQGNHVNRQPPVDDAVPYVGSLGKELINLSAKFLLLGVLGFLEQ